MVINQFERSFFFFFVAIEINFFNRSFNTVNFQTGEFALISDGRVRCQIEFDAQFIGKITHIERYFNKRIMESQEIKPILKYRATHTLTVAVDGTAIVQIFERTEPGLYNGSNPDVFNVEEISRGEENYFRLLETDPRRARYFNLRKITEAEYRKNIENFLKLNEEIKNGE